MQIKKLAILLAAASLATVMLTGCPWDEEDKTDDAASSTPGSSSSSSQPGGDEDDGPATYTVKASVNGEGGTVTVNPESVQQGGGVTVTINPGSGYAIDSVTDNGNDVTSKVIDNNTYIIQNVTENHAITVTFKPAIDPTNPKTWPRKDSTIIAPAEIELTADLAKAMLDVEGVDSIDLSQSGITSIPDGTFQNSNLVSITVPNGTEIEIGKNAFKGCTSLKTVNGTLGDVDKYAFYGCGALTGVTVNGSVGERAFSNCDALKTVNGTLGNVDKYAFSGCGALTGVTVNGSVGLSAFYNCGALTSAWVNGEVGRNAFYACSNLQHLRVGEEFEITGTSAFSLVTNLTVYYTGEENNENQTFKNNVIEQLKNAGATVTKFEFGYTDDKWAAITNQAGNGKLASFLLGL